MPKTLSPDDIRQFREAMRRVAENAFATRGAEGVTMRELARELGCSAMTPYRYFRDKDEILAMVRAAAFNRFAARLETAAQTATETDHSVVSEAYVAFAFDEPHAYRLMFDLTQRDSVYPELAAASQRAWRMLGAHFERLVGAGILEGDPRLIGYAYWASLHGFTMLALADQLPLPQAQQPAAHNTPTREAVFAQIRRMLWRGAQPQRG
ncbi:bacterial regulatory s, tetR family protein [Paraburkholderia xenovorans LB400]|jgi:AcrR family transcriptional regulator|uniref:Transcriptional regulator, TetR family n=1 Tax=Paraburkholderia xenovorans (strain LB400) TaxID=266265 RepID=Q13UE6_PARXL|nr:TetR/AcrR family transcriptional regulator [Paraburkholderia xenovorans]ABE32293.1 transcriptional regulator, TetR family [Paraburkholderia xenovorans LB400]AIP30466.1 bacterial regulatory s, tetR family protein [Paraburkholderia xenovorans LB400]